MMFCIKKHRRSGAFYHVSTCAVPVMTTVLPVLMMCSMSAAVSVLMPVPVLVLVAMRALALIRAALKRPREVLLHGFIRVPLHAGHERNACLDECRLRSRANSATDDEIDLRRVEKSRNRTMPLADRIHDLL